VIVTIDGPAGAGKSWIARQVADKLEFEFLYTGAMYRAVTLGAIRANIDLEDIDALVNFASGIQLGWVDHRVILDGVDVTDSIRTPDVTAAIRYLADLPAVRYQLSLQQRRIAEGRDIVTEGRDQGSEVFPDAECKIFLTASPVERARRRQQQLAESGRHVQLEDVLKAQDQRDAEDRQRPIGALRPADDARILESDGMTLDEVLQRAIEIVEESIESNRVNGV
jgi:cytidylate kinase/pantoate ligase/cytidylate kinase